MGRALPKKQLIRAVLFASMAVSAAVAQTPCNSTEAPPTMACPPGIPLPPNTFAATPLIDGNTSITWPPPSPNGVSGTEIVTLYGRYGSIEQNNAHSEAAQHYTDGVNEGSKIRPLCSNGMVPNPGCFDNQPPAIVFMFIGFSNCTMEVCGGNSDIWANHTPQLSGQPCATSCPNPTKGNLTLQSWNNISGDPVQRSLIYQAYGAPNHFLNTSTSHVYIFDAAEGGEPLDHWDPNAYYSQVGSLCDVPNDPTDPECEYTAAAIHLSQRGLHEEQVQAIFIKDSTSYPRCDLSGLHCTSASLVPDAYLSEQYLGNIMRYLKQGFNGNAARYRNLHQVFITSRIYGGYAQNPPVNPGDPPNTAGCLSPEPYSYEEGFSVQRLIVAQIRQDANLSSNDVYAQQVRYKVDGSGDAPWFDWGPYIWASKDTPRNDGLFWCNGQSGQCNGNRDFRFGDLSDQHDFWGDFTHPTQPAIGKVADKIVDFLIDPQNPNNLWVANWIGQ